MEAFPRKQLAEYLASWYRERTSSALRRPKTASEVLRTGGTVFDVQPELASLVAVGVLLRLKDILGYEPSKAVLKRGGYRSQHEFVQQMLGSLEASWLTMAARSAHRADQRVAAHG